MDRNAFHKLLAFGIERGVSDIHFEVGYPPHYRLHGELLGRRSERRDPEGTGGQEAPGSGAGRFHHYQYAPLRLFITATR